MTRSLTRFAMPLLLVAAPAYAAPDGDFLTEAMKGDNAEVAMGRLAMAKGGTAKVREFGKMLVDDHGAHKTKVAALAVKMKLAATDALPADGLRNRKMLEDLSGAAFDQAFKRDMIEDHQKDIAKYEAQAKSGQSADVRALASDTLPTLRHHLETAQAL